MKVRFPFWNRISEGWKQFLVVAAGIQAIWFFIVTPLSVIDSIRYSNTEKDFEWVPNLQYASTEIKAEFYTNLAGPFQARHFEECEHNKTFLTYTHRKDDIINCNELLSVTEIIENHINNSKLELDEANTIRSEFEVWDKYYEEMRSKL